MNLNKSSLLLALLAAPLPPARAAAVTRARYLMGTTCEITAHGPGAGAAASAAFAEIERWDRTLSLYEEESEASTMNRSAARAPFPCSPELWEALSLALTLARESGGAFDPTVLPAIRQGAGSLGLVGHEKVALDAARRTVSFAKEGMGLDFGAVGKGLALDHAARVLRERGTDSALINFGGQVYALGAPPGLAAWAVEVPGLDSPLFLRSASASTSGNSERPGHIVSPWTGKPLRRDGSVTVVAPTGAEADAWSTALYVLGPRQAPDYKGCVIWNQPAGPRPRGCEPYRSRPQTAGPASFPRYTVKENSP